MTAHRIALISDIHGNELALRKVIADARRLGTDQIACLGDVATLGPRPREVLAIVREACDVFILGNHDEYLFDPRSISRHTSSPIVVGAIEECRQRLSRAELDFVKSFSRSVRIGADGDDGLLLFHGSPNSNDCDLLAETPDPDLARQLEGHTAAVMAGGHTHVQMLRQHRGQLLLNPGSVGLPFERFVAGGPPKVLAHAEYAIVEFRDGQVGVELRRLPLERSLLAEAARAWSGPMAAYLAAQYASTSA